MTSNYQSLYCESCDRYPYIGRKSVEEKNIRVEKDIRVDFIYQFVKKRHVKINYNPSVIHLDIIGPPKYGEPPQKLKRWNNDIDISITPWQYEEESMSDLPNIILMPLRQNYYIDIEFHEAVYPIRVSMYEMYNPGNVIQISAQDDSNNEWFKLWGIDYHKSKIVSPTSSRLFSPPLYHPRDFKTKMLRLFFNSSRNIPFHTKLDAVMLIGTSVLVRPRYYYPLTNLLKEINRMYFPHQDIHNLTADFKNAHLDIDYLQRHFFEYCIIMEYCRDGSYIRRVFKESILRENLMHKNVSLEVIRHSNYAKCIKLSSDESKELSRPNISELPDEILLIILKNLDLMTLRRLRDVNRRFNDLTQDPELYTRLNIHCSSSAKNFDLYMAKRDMSNIFCYITSRYKYLRQVDLTKSPFDVEDFKNFLDNCGRRLTHLKLGYCSSINNLAVLKISEICVNLKELNLDYCHGIDDEGFSYLEKLNNLEHLNLRNTYIKAECLYKILQKNQRMREFNFEPRNYIRNTAVTQFIKLCPNLEVVRLQKHSKLTSQDIDVLADCKNLRKVYLPEIADDCLHRLLSSWQRLELVTLCRIHLTDHNLKLLTQCKNLKQLQLYRMKLTCNMCATILEQCPKLQEFHLIDCNINNCLVNEWKKRYPHVSIYTLE